MKVLTLSWEYPPRVIGGIARVVYDLSHQMLNADVENHIITCGSNELPSYEREDDLHIHRVLPFAIQNYNFIEWVYHLNMSMIAKAIKVVIDNGPFDLIHAHDWITAFSSVTLKTAFNYPLISTIHATEFGRNNGLHNDTQRYISNVEWWLTYESWRVICNSKYMENQLMSFFQLPLDKIRMIPNGVQIENFQTKAVDKEFKTNYSSYDEKLVFYVGRLVQEKGVHILIQAIPHVLRQYNNVKFVISGTGPYADHLKKMAIDLGINNKIYFTGFIDDDTRNKLFKISDTAVFPSLYEPFGIVALEGMAAQVPVIVSDTGGLREIVNHGKDGMKFTCGSSEDLAAQIVTLLRNPQMAARIALSGLKKVKELYNWELISEHTLEVYKEVLKQNYSLSYTQKA